MGTQEGDVSSSSAAFSATFTKDHVMKLVSEMLFSAITTAINCDFNVVFEGVLSINRFKDLFERLQAVPNILCHFVYLDVPLSVTLERHKGREKCKTIPESDIIRWRKNERDEKTHYLNELVIQGGVSPLDDTVEAIVNHVKKHCLLGSSFSESKKRTNDDCNSTGTTKSEPPVKLDNDNHSNNDSSNSGGCGDSINKKARISVSYN